MKSIRKKMVLLVVASVLLASLINSFAGLYTMSEVLDDEADKIMNLKCEQNASQLNNIFNNIADMVGTLAIRAKDELSDINNLKNDDYLKEYTSSLEKSALTHAKELDEVLGLYVAYNPEYTSPTAGFYWKREDTTENFRKVARTDLSAYEKDDFEHVGWYYTPVENKKPTWMMPYVKANAGNWTISYVVPIYKGKQLVGVVGMDIDFDLISKATEKIKVYESGHAFIVNKEGQYVYHPDYKCGEAIANYNKNLAKVIETIQKQDKEGCLVEYKESGKTYCLVCQTLQNGMLLCITVPQKEITNERDTLIQKNVGITVLVICLSLFVAMIFCRQLIKPLEKLNEAAHKVADGNLDITLQPATKDEVGELTQSFQKMISNLKEYVNTISSLAYKDAMTGVHNKAAYHEMEKRLDENIKRHEGRFAVAVFDVNNLKHANDHYGHMAGDELICCISSHICQTFSHSPVYRVGGDEFVAILETSDLEHYMELLQQFEEGLRELSLTQYSDVNVSCAMGIAVYDSKQDKSYLEVFKRADGFMYEKKQSMKKGDIR